MTACSLKGIILIFSLINDCETRSHSFKIRNIRLEQRSVDTATPSTVWWCSQCKRENPITEYKSTDARGHGLIKSCRCCRKAQVRSKRRRKGDDEYEYDTEHDGRPQELENDTERTDIVRGCSPQEHDNGQMSLCSDCNQETSVGGALEQSSRRVTKLLAFRRALCTKCLQRHDIRIGQGSCGFQDCEWKKGKKPFIDHWEKVHAPKNLECSFPDCLSTISGTTFNQFGLEQHVRGTTIPELRKLLPVGTSAALDIFFPLLFPNDPLVGQNHRARPDALMCRKIVGLIREVIKPPEEQKLTEYEPEIIRSLFQTSSSRNRKEEGQGPRPVSALSSSD